MHIFCLSPRMFRLVFSHSLVVFTVLSFHINIGLSNELANRWNLIGTDNDAIRLPNGTIQLLETRKTPAGILSPILKTPSPANAILVEVSAICEAKNLKFAVFDAETGNCIGYWTNPLTAAQETRLTAVLPFSDRAESIRLFVGSHRPGAKATFRNIKFSFLRRGMQHAAAVYGALIDHDHTVRQTLKATGDQFGAVTFRIRRAGGFVESPNLSVRIYRWHKDTATTTQSEPLAEFIVPGKQIPGTRQGGVDEVELAATYLDGAREISVPLQTATQPGETLVLELAVDDPKSDGIGFITFGWLNGYEGGMLYENNSTRGRDWDLRLETFDAVK